MLISGAHIHRGEIRDSIYTKDTSLSIPLLISPSICPVYMNNPGYATLEIHGGPGSDEGNELTMKNLEISYF